MKGQLLQRFESIWATGKFSMVGDRRMQQKFNRAIKICLRRAKMASRGNGEHIRAEIDSFSTEGKFLT
jgi:hypothetical protein